MGSAITYLYLAMAIVFEVIATSSQSSESCRPFPSIVSVIGYLVTFYFLALTLRTMPVGIAYAIWSGSASFCLRRSTGSGSGKLDLPAIIGLGLIILGVVTVNLFSRPSSTDVIPARPLAEPSTALFRQPSAGMFTTMPG